MSWSTKEKTSGVEVYFANKSYIVMQADFRRQFHAPSKTEFLTWFMGSSAAPEDVLQRPLLSTKCAAWVAISKIGINGPYWFENENERLQTVNTER